MKPKRVARPFDYHKPEAEEIARIESIRAAYQQCLERVTILTSEGSVSGRYQSLAFTALEESAMWATKSVVFERENEDAPVR